MTLLNDLTQTTWALESKALSPAWVGDTVERELRANRSTRGTWHDALLLALRCRNQSARPDRCSWYTWEGLWHPSGANAIARPATTSKERTTSALQPQRTGLDQQPERAWKWIPQNLPEEIHSTIQLQVLQHLCFAPIPKRSRPYGPSTPLNPQHLPECLLHTLTKSSSSLFSSFLFLSLVLLSCFNHILTELRSISQS